MTYNNLLNGSISSWSMWVPTKVLDYTPIVIDFKSAFLNEANEPVYHPNNLNKPQYFMRINPPRTNNRGVEQYVADSLIVPIGQDGMFRYKLRPSNLYLPFGRYKVEFYRKGNQIPLDIQSWNVPPVPVSLQYAFTYTGEDNNGEIKLPLFIWNITNIDPVYNFVSTYNSLSFLSANPPLQGTNFKITYEQAVTYDRLFEYNTNLIETINHSRS